MKELSNIKPNLPETAYLLAYPNLRALVPGCDNLAEAIENSCVGRKPTLAFYYQDGWVMIAQAEIDRAWAYVSRLIAA